MSTGAFYPQIQAFLTINTACFLMVNQPAFPAQKNINALNAIANTGFGNFPYPLRNGPVITATAIVVHRATLHHQTAATTQSDTVSFQADMPPRHAFARASELFSDDILNISLSRLRSVTSRFRR
ncbi:hypothetical protein F152LOC_02052 [Pectobacterium brasiliense]|nr:hypothetical protein F152LOC_02052 [Pectobacterium brasiliense]